jgi:hypothetical protein
LGRQNGRSGVPFKLVTSRTFRLVRPLAVDNLAPIAAS